MGASAALLFADLATSVLAFCPQIEFKSSYFRPYLPPEKHSVLTDRILKSLAASRAKIEVLVASFCYSVNPVFRRS